MKCAIAWSSLYIQADGKVTPCCGDLRFGDVKEGLVAVFNGAEATKLRNQMLSNSIELPGVCSNCSLLSRMGSSNTFQEMFPWIYDSGTQVSPHLLSSYLSLSNSYDKDSLPPADSKPLSLMVQFGELCNIQCIMCPQDHLNPVAISEEAVARIKEVIPFVSKMTFTGGEPTAFKECWEISDFFNTHAPTEAHLGILTNLKMVTKQRVERYFSNVNNLGLGINVDAATKQTYEHIRRGANWEQFNNNLHDLIEYKNLNNKAGWHFNLTMTVMKSNLHEMVRLIEWCVNLGIGFGCGPITGDFGPVKNARTYFEENIFRYSHLNVTKEEMISVFESALKAAENIPEPYRKGSKQNITGMIEITRNTPQVCIPHDDVEILKGLTDNELSLALQGIVLEGVAPWKSSSKIARTLLKRVGHRISWLVNRWH